MSHHLSYILEVLALCLRNEPDSFPAGIFVFICFIQQYLSIWNLSWNLTFMCNLHVSYVLKPLYFNLVFSQYHFWICLHSWSSWFLLPESLLDVKMPKDEHMTKRAVCFLPETYRFDIMCAQFSNVMFWFFSLFLFDMVDNILLTLWKKLYISDSDPSS